MNCALTNQAVLLHLPILPAFVLIGADATDFVKAIANLVDDY